MVLILFALLLVFVLRPTITMMSTVAGGFAWGDRTYWAWFGLRGIGSIYYLSYAINAGIEESMARLLLAATAIAVLASVLVHGLSMPFILRRCGHDADSGR